MSWLIGEMAEKAGLTPDTLRYYERIGLLPAPGRNAGGRRIYRARDFDRIKFIKRVQAAGFTLDEIGHLLRFRENPTGTSGQVRQLAVHKHQLIRAQIELLQRMEGELALLIALCPGQGDDCPILDRFEQP